MGFLLLQLNGNHWQAAGALCQWASVMMCEWNEEELHQRKKKEKLFCPSLSTFCLLFSFVCLLFVHLTSCFVVFVVLKSPKMEGKVTKGLGQSLWLLVRAPAAGKQLLETRMKTMCFCYLIVPGQRKMLYHGNLAVCMLWGHGRVVF